MTSFRFLQRHEFMQKKFSSQRSYQVNPNSRGYRNFHIRTMYEEDPKDIQYCEGVNSNIFLLKYFKFSCVSCMRLCSQTLVTDCCKESICIGCCHYLFDQFKNGEIDPFTHCIYCSKPVEKLYLFRDPYQQEKKMLAKKTIDSYR